MELTQSRAAVTEAAAAVTSKNADDNNDSDESRVGAGAVAGGCGVLGSHEFYQRGSTRNA